MASKRLAWLAGGLLLCRSALAAPALDVTLDGLTAKGHLPLSSAFCLPKDAAGTPQDKSPGIRWRNAPKATRSFVLLAVDPDVTTDLSLMNKPGVVIPTDSPRQDIWHWVLIDIPPTIHRLAPGEEGDRFVPGGKPIGPTGHGVRGSNDYWPYFNKNPSMPESMKGPYGGYDGPCPPNNDQKIHDYKFRVFALDVPSLGLTGQFFAADVLRAMQGHVLAQGEAAAPFDFNDFSIPRR